MRVEWGVRGRMFWNDDGLGFSESAHGKYVDVVGLIGLAVVVTKRQTCAGNLLQGSSCE